MGFTSGHLKSKNSKAWNATVIIKKLKLFYLQLSAAKKAVNF